MKIMTDSTKKASGVAFTLLVLIGVGMAIMFSVDRAVEGNAMLRDERDGDLMLRRLVIDEITHAGQFLPPAEPKDKNEARKKEDFSRLPVTYWHPRGPVGQVLSQYDWFPGRENTWRSDARLPASLVGLGASMGPLPIDQLAAAWSEPPIAGLPLKAGALAAYARPFQVVDFYEPKPAIYELSFPRSGEPKFTFVHDAQRRGAMIRVFQGNERELLGTRAPERFYHAFFVDTVRGDFDDLAEDLLTEEGMAALMATVAENGILAFHVSNKKYDVVPVIADVATNLKFACMLAEDRNDRGKGHYPSEWVLVARRPEALANLNRGAGEIRWSAPVPRRRHAWTDAGPRERDELRRR